MDKKKEYLVRRISPQETYDDLLKFPRYLEVETINSCNARCPMCTISDWKRGSKPMTDELFNKIAREVTAHAGEVRRVTLYRDGEPLLDRKLAERIATLKGGGIKSTSISTNVSLLNEAKARELLEAGIDIVIMSIDSLKKDVYEGIRVKLKFEEVMKNALKFIELRNSIRPQTRIWMRMIRQDDNYDEWPEYKKYWKERLLATDRIYYHNIFNWGNQLKGFRPVSKSYEPNLPCVALWSLMVIFSDGEVPLCNVDYNKKYPVGNVLSDSIEGLWRSANLEKKRMMHLEGGKRHLDICEKCNVWDESPDNSDVISDQYAQAVEID